MNKDDIAGLIRDLRTHAYDDCGERDIPTHIGNQAADALTALSARVETLKAEIRRYVGVHGVLTEADRIRLKTALGGNNG